MMFRAGLKRVVAGMVDPDQRVSGQGIRYLQDRNIIVDIMDGKEHKLCKEINLPFIYRTLYNQSYCVDCNIDMSIVTSLYQSYTQNHFPKKSFNKLHVFKRFLTYLEDRVSCLDCVYLSQSNILKLLSLTNDQNSSLFLYDLLPKHQTMILSMIDDNYDSNQEYDVRIFLRFLKNFLSESHRKIIVIVNENFMKNINETTRQTFLALIQYFPDCSVWNIDCENNDRSLLQIVRKKCCETLQMNGILHFQLIDNDLVPVPVSSEAQASLIITENNHKNKMMKKSPRKFFRKKKISFVGLYVKYQKHWKF
jgi:hypothetical protein